MNPNDLWAQPPYPDKGDASETPIFTAVGKALSSWESLEGTLATLFVRFIAYNRDSIVARRAYGSVVSFSARADMLDHTASAYFSLHPDDALRAVFDKLLKECRRASPRRNDIAHGIVVQAHLPGQTDVTHCLAPSLYNVRRLDVFNKPDYLYSAVEIAKFTAGFDDLYASATHLARQLLKPHPANP